MVMKRKEGAEKIFVHEGEACWQISLKSVTPQCSIQSNIISPLHHIEFKFS